MPYSRFPYWPINLLIVPVPSVAYRLIGNFLYQEVHFGGKGGNIIRYCPSCGSANDETSRFCIKCGSTLQPVIEHPEDRGALHPSDMGGEDEAPAQGVTTPLPPPGYQVPQKKGSGAKIAAVAIVAILLVAAIAIILLDFPFNDETPSLLNPIDGATVDGHYPSFAWTAVTDADGYQIVVLREGEVVVIDELVEDTEFQASYLEDGIYEWNVRAELGGGWSEWSQVYMFFVGTSTLNRHYEWEFDGRSWSWDMMINASEYYYYKNQPRTYDYGSYMTEDNEYIMSLSQSLKDRADDEGWSSYELVSFTLAFVQSLEYTSDSVTTGYDEYPRYPIETLVDEGGDCEDTSVLFSSLIEADPINIDAVLLILPADNPEHMAAGVAGGSGIHGTYYEYDGRDYYYCETTGEGWMVGDIPPEYRHVTVEIIQV
jgi:hypothetical protein